MVQRVAVLGAGASGLVASKCCLDEGLVPVCFEKTGEIGGLWNYTESIDEGVACVMKTTVINTSKEMMCYSDYPIPADYPNYMHNSKVFQYFKLYANNFKLYEHIRFHREVISVRRSEDFEETGEWLVEYVDLKSEKREVVTERFQAVLLCSGHHAEKRLPNFPGEDDFKGEIVHTHDYKDHRGYEDKNVVVVGVGNSGGDVAVELSKIAKQVYLSTRRGAWVINRVVENGMPVDVALRSRLLETITNILGEKLANRSIKRRINQRFDHAMYGLMPNHEPLSQHPTVNDELPNRIVCGTVVVKPNIKRLTESGVIFEDGTYVEADKIIYATGYIFGFPYLEKGVIEVNDNAVDLYKYAFPPDVRPGTIAVIGCIQPWGAIMPIAELQCRWACRVFKGLTSLPSRNIMWRDINDKRTAMSERYVTSTRHTIQVDWIPFMDQVAEEFGCKPNIVKLFLTDPALALKVYFGPCTPYQYRLMGPGKWAGARDAIMTQMDRVFQPFKTRPVPSDQQSSGHMKQIMAMIVLFLVLYYIFF